MKISKPGQKLVSIATSPTVAVLLFILCSLALVAGSIIPQREMAESLVGRLPPQVMAVLDTLQLFDVYRSVWFIVLVALLVCNLIACLSVRMACLPILHGGHRCPSLPQDEPTHTTTIRETSSRRTAEDLARIIGMHFHTVLHNDTAEGAIIFGRRGSLRLMSLFIIHVSILVIIAGMATGFLFGFRAYVEIPEGDSTDTVYLREEPWEKALSFTVTCNKFSITQHPNGVPRMYLSHLVFAGKDGDACEQTVMVNQPVSYENIRFYQSNHGTIPEARITVTEGDREHFFTVREGSTLRLPGMKPDHEVHILAIESNLMNLGPAIEIGVEMPGEKLRFYAFQNIDAIREAISSLITEVPRLNPARFEPFLFRLRNIEERFYTGLTLDYDPGLPLVFTGGLLFLVGVILASFSTFERIWIILRDADGGCRITVMSLRGATPAPLAPSVEQYLTERTGNRT